MGLKAWWRRTFGKDRETTNNDEVVAGYVMAGAEFGSAVSYIYMGECVGFEDLLRRWEDAENSYALLGYKTLSIDDFVHAGAYDIEIEPLLRQPRKVGEEPVFHAAYYRKNFLGKHSMTDAVKKALAGEVAFGSYVRPSTEHLKE